MPNNINTNLENDKYLKIELCINEFLKTKLSKGKIKIIKLKNKIIVLPLRILILDKLL
tara:strand:+ start:224 stop:397 length:174 start_codon:yes stop_codon:yes gene_type:complete